MFSKGPRHQIVDGMIANMKFQIENPALLNSRFVFDEFLYLDVNFHQLNLTRGSSYLPLPDWLASKKAIVNPHNDDKECFKWSVIVAENAGMKDPQLVSNLRNNKKRSHTQIDSRKQVIAFQDRVITINIKEAQHPLKREKQVIDKSSIMLKNFDKIHASSASVRN